MHAYTFISSSFILSVSGWQVFPASTVSEYGSYCASILSRNITLCNTLVQVLDPSIYYSNRELQLSCKSSCGAALKDWYGQATNACSNITYTDPYGNRAAVSSILGELAWNFNTTCLSRDGRFCNVVLGQLANANSNSSSNGTASECNDCARDVLRNQADSPFSDGPLVYSQSIYQSYTSKCRYSGYPLTTTPGSRTLPFTYVRLRQQTRVCR